MLSLFRIFSPYHTQKSQLLSCSSVNLFDMHAQISDPLWKPRKGMVAALGKLDLEYVLYIHRYVDEQIATT